MALLFACVHTLALAQKAPASDTLPAPEITRVDVTPPEPLKLEGTAAPRDRIVLRVDGRRVAEATADENGRWHAEVSEPLSAGKHRVTATALATGSARIRISNDVRIELSEAALAKSAQGPNDAHAPPNAATRKRASELARDAAGAFDELTGRKEAKPAEPEAQPATAAESLPPAGPVTAWLTRARRDYLETLVAGLTDPERQRRNGIEPRDVAPAGPWHGESRFAAYVAPMMSWFERTGRVYQDEIVLELALRGIEDLEARTAARSEALQLAAASDAQLPPASPEEEPPSAEEQRRAEGKQLAEERAAAERLEAQERAFRMAIEQAKALAETRVREREAREAKAKARELAEIEREEQERLHAEAERRAEEIRNERALAGRLAERARERQAQEQAAQEAARREQELAEQRRREDEEKRQQLEAERRDEAVRTEQALSERLERARQSPPQVAAGDAGVKSPPLPEQHRRTPAPEAKRAEPRAGRSAKRTRKIAAKPSAHRPRSRREARRQRHRDHNRRHRYAARTMAPPGVYVVKRGDTLWDIARRHYGSGEDYRRIHRANRRKIARPSRIYPGQRLRLPARRWASAR